jgi:hypothetical protein
LYIGNGNDASMINPFDLFGSDTNTKPDKEIDITNTHNFTPHENSESIQYQPSSSSQNINHLNNMELTSQHKFENSDKGVCIEPNQTHEMYLFEATNEYDLGSLGVEIEDDDDFGDFEDASTCQGISVTGCDTVFTINTLPSLSPEPILGTIVTNASLSSVVFNPNAPYINPLLNKKHKSIYDPESPKLNVYSEFSTATTTTEISTEPTTPLDISPNILDSKYENMESESLQSNHLKSPISGLSHLKSPISKDKLDKLALQLISKDYFEEAYCCLQMNISLISEQNMEIWTKLTLSENNGKDMISICF